MKKVRNLLAALILSLALVVQAPAGDILMGATGQNPPPGSTQTSQQQNNSAATTGSESNEQSTASALDPVTEALLGLLNGILSIF